MALTPLAKVPVRMLDARLVEGQTWENVRALLAHVRELTAEPGEAK